MSSPLLRIADAGRQGKTAIRQVNPCHPKERRTMKTLTKHECDVVAGGLRKPTHLLRRKAKKFGGEHALLMAPVHGINHPGEGTGSGSSGGVSSGGGSGSGSSGGGSSGGSGGGSGSSGGGSSSDCGTSGAGSPPTVVTLPTVHVNATLPTSASATWLGGSNNEVAYEFPDGSTQDLSGNISHSYNNPLDLKAGEGSIGVGIDGFRIFATTQQAFQDAIDHYSSDDALGRDNNVDPQFNFTPGQETLTDIVGIASPPSDNNNDQTILNDINDALGIPSSMDKTTTVEANSTAKCTAVEGSLEHRLRRAIA